MGNQNHIFVSTNENTEKKSVNNNSHLPLKCWKKKTEKENLYFSVCVCVCMWMWIPQKKFYELFVIWDALRLQWSRLKQPQSSLNKLKGDREQQKKQKKVIDRLKKCVFSLEILFKIHAKHFRIITLCVLGMKF